MPGRLFHGSGRVALDPALWIEMTPRIATARSQEIHGRRGVADRAACPGLPDSPCPPDRAAGADSADRSAADRPSADVIGSVDGIDTTFPVVNDGTVPAPERLPAADPRPSLARRRTAGERGGPAPRPGPAGSNHGAVSINRVDPNTAG